MSDEKIRKKYGLTTGQLAAYKAHHTMSIGKDRVDVKGIRRAIKSGESDEEIMKGYGIDTRSLAAYKAHVTRAKKKR
jgi:hypothetical protein